MKAICNVTLSFGLISLPVGICKATGELDDVSFNLGDEQGSRLSQQYVNTSGTVVPSNEQTRMFNGHIVDKDALANIAEQTKLTDMTILKIEKRERFLDQAHRITGSYFVQSTKKVGNDKAFKLFVDALRNTSSVAISKVCLRTRQQLFVLWPDEYGNLRGSTLSFASDDRSADDNVKSHQSSSYETGEMKMAVQILKALSSSKSDPLNDATDEAIALRKALVQQYLDGEFVPVVSKPQPEKNAALADALAASLEAIKAAA